MTICAYLKCWFSYFINVKVTSEINVEVTSEINIKKKKVDQRRFFFFFANPVDNLCAYLSRDTMMNLPQTVECVFVTEKEKERDFFLRHQILICSSPFSYASIYSGTNSYRFLSQKRFSMIRLRDGRSITEASSLAK